MEPEPSRKEVGPPAPKITSRARRFVEVCGEHPFATGLFAIIGILGLAFSIFTFALDRRQAAADSLDTREIQATIATVSAKLDDAVTVQDAIEVVPIVASLYESDRADNLTFSAKHIGQDLAWIQKNDPSSVAHDPFPSFSFKSVTNKEFVQIAPYLVVEVLDVAPMPPNRAVISEGERGGAGDLREFRIYIPAKVGTYYAPLLDPETYEYSDKVKYISLMPREQEEGIVYVNIEPDYIYSYRIGMHYKFADRHDVYWIPGIIKAGFPKEEVPVVSWGRLLDSPGLHMDMEARGASDFDIVKAAQDSAAWARSGKVFRPSQLK